MEQDRRTFMQQLVFLAAASLLPYSCTTSENETNSMENTSPSVKPKLLILDVNETLLDLSSMKARMNTALGHEFAFAQWFSLMLQYSLVDNVTGQYHPFGEIGKAAFQMTEQMLRKEISENERDDLLGMIRQLPPHPDVVKGLSMLRDAGYRMVTLTNSTEEVVQQQMKAAGLTQYFDTLLSIDPMRKYKPALETYRQATDKLDVRPEEAMLIAAHSWDVTGALHAGLQAAFISRERKAHYPLAPNPQYTGDSLIQIAEKLIRL